MLHQELEQNFIATIDNLLKFHPEQASIVLQSFAQCQNVDQWNRIRNLFLINHLPKNKETLSQDKNLTYWEEVFNVLSRYIILIEPMDRRDFIMQLPLLQVRDEIHDKLGSLLPSSDILQ
jgi:hypothetical protein